MSLTSLTALINSLLPEPQAGLLAGILFGVKATMDTDLYNSLVTTGTLHIIALSGMNISILVSLVQLTLVRFVRRPIANLASVIIIIGFILFVGPSPSVLRAGLMGAISLFAVTLGRQTWSFFTWILAISLMLLLNPLWISDLSFQLSAMASLGIILFGKKTTIAGPVAGFLPRIPTRGPLLGSPSARVTRFVWDLIKDDLRVTLAAQVFTVPIIMFQFGRISLVSPLSNVLIGWLVAPIMVAGFALVFSAFIWMPLATVVAWLTWVPLTYVVYIVQWTARLPFASIAW